MYKLTLFLFQLIFLALLDGPLTVLDELHQPSKMRAEDLLNVF